MEENDRTHRNRINQRRRRRGLMRIDYIPSKEARQVIDAERKRQGQEWHALKFLDVAVTTWMDCIGKDAGSAQASDKSARKWRIVEDNTKIHTDIDPREQD